MTIWVLAVLLLAALGALGLKQGAIRVGFSFLGIVLGALLAAPIGHLLKPALSAAGMKNPIWISFLPPCIGFLIVLTIFKIAGFFVHRKAELYYKHSAGDLRYALWQRMNGRLGLCLGLLNGAAYLVLASAAIFVISYWTYQIATPDSNPRAMRIVNRLGKDLQSSHMNNVAAAVDTLPSAYYEAADITGLVYHNPLLEARLSRYPDFLALGQRPEFQALAKDLQFTEALQQRAPVGVLLKNPNVQAILNNPALLKTIAGTLVPDLPDLRGFLETGRSQKYSSEPILGRWDFDLNGVIALVQKQKPNLTPAELLALRQSFGYFSKTTLVAAPSGDAFLINLPHFSPGPNPVLQMQSAQGHWKNSGGQYDVVFNIDGKDQDLTGTIQEDRLALTGVVLQLAFVRED